MLNTLSKIAVVLNSFVVVLYAWNPIFHRTPFTKSDIIVIALSLLSAILNGSAILNNKKDSDNVNES